MQIEVNFVNRKIEKESLLCRLFDLSTLIYLIAYFTYYQDESMGRIRLIGTLMLLGTGGLLFLTNNRKPDLQFFWFSIFILFSLVSILWAKDSLSITSVLPSLFRILFFSLFMSSRIQKVADIERILWIYLIVVLYMDVVVGKKMVNYYSWSAFYLNRFGANFNYNPNSISILNVFASIITLYSLKKEHNKMKKAIIIGLFVFYVCIILLTGSKKGVISLLLGLFLLLYYKAQGVKKFERILVGGLVVIIALEFLMNVQVLYDIVGYRFDKMFSTLSNGNNIDVSTENREKLIKNALKVWAGHPIVGVGLNNFKNYQTIYPGDYYAHNNYVEILADLGIIGMLIYYSLYIKIARYKIDNKNELQILMKSLFFIIAFTEIGLVSYSDIRIQLFILIISIYLFRLSSEKKINIEPSV